MTGQQASGGKRDLGDKVLLLATSHTGNNIFCTPAISFLKKHYPATHFDVVAPKRLNAQVFERNPAIGRVYNVRRAPLVRWIAKDYNHVIALHYKSNYMIEGSAIPHFLSSGLTPDTHDAEHILQDVAGYVGCAITDEDRAYVIPSRPAGSPAVLAPYQVVPQDRVIGMHLGVGRVAIHGWKRFYKNATYHPRLWEVEKYIELAQKLQAYDGNIRLAIIGTRNEAFLGKQFAREVPGTIDLIGQTTVSDLKSLMGEIEMFVSGDSGVLHIAASSPIPLVALFGPTLPSENGPWPRQPWHRVLKKDAMADYTVEEVYQAVVDSLEQASTTSG